MYIFSQFSGFGSSSLDPVPVGKFFFFRNSIQRWKQNSGVLNPIGCAFCMLNEAQTGFDNTQLRVFVLEYE
jgi:hypothetical protein